MIKTPFNTKYCKTASKKLGSFLVIFILLLTANSAFAKRTFASLPTTYRENKVKEVENGFEERSKMFLQGRQFRSWKFNKPDDEIKTEYENLNEWRNHTWYSESSKTALISRPDFMIAQDLLEKGYYKRPHLIAFHYNQTDGSYNSSTIVLNGQHFLAMEAPSTPKLTDNFFKLLQNFQVTQLVRLTPEQEKDIPKSIPYWNNRVSKDVKTGALTLNAPQIGTDKTYPIHYYVIENWFDNRGISPEILLNIIQDIRKHYDPKAGLLACHCSGGVGRTGTFLAAFLLIQILTDKLSKVYLLTILISALKKLSYNYHCSA